MQPHAQSLTLLLLRAACGCPPTPSRTCLQGIYGNDLDSGDTIRLRDLARQSDITEVEKDVDELATKVGLGLCACRLSPPASRARALSLSLSFSPSTTARTSKRMRMISPGVACRRRLFSPAGCPAPRLTRR